MKTQKVAWTVSDEETSWIVFAESGKEAARKGANELDTDPECVEAVRAPQWDKHATLGYVPPREMIEAGWWLVCRQCWRKIDNDNEQEDEDGGFYHPDPVFVGSESFCSQRCYDKSREDDLIRQARKQEAIAHIVKTWPKAKQALVVNGGHPGYEVYATFRFGSNGRAEWKSSDPDHVSIRQTDVDEWNRWLGDEKFTLGA